VKVNPSLRNQRQLIWPATGIMIGALVSMNPFYAPHLTLEFGVTVWGIALALGLFLPGHPVVMRLATVLTGLLLAVPCFVRATPLARGLLMCCMFVPVVMATALLFVPPSAGIRARLANLFNWSGSHEVNFPPRRFDVAALVQLVIATIILALAIAAVKVIPHSGAWLIGRWFAGGVVIFAFAEMVTAGLALIPAAFGVTVMPLMHSPYRSASVGEFWTRRWNIFASQKIFRPFIFAPLLRRGTTLALLVVFAGSGIAHVLLIYMAMGKWGIALMQGAFFLLQPLLILTERKLAVRRWPRWMAHAWTLSGLAIVSPLFVEPALQVIEPSWGTPDNVLGSTLITLGFVLFLCGLVATGSRAGKPARVSASRVAAPAT
jgi:hypothetical protein